MERYAIPEENMERLKKKLATIKGGNPRKV